MKFQLGIWFLLLSLFVAVSTNHAWACGEDQAGGINKRSVSKSCCKGESSQAFANSDETPGSCEATHPGQSCPPDEDGCGGCHCPGCGVVSTSHAGNMLIEFPSLLPFLYDSGHAKREAFYFAEHIPEAVCLPIWQPPKIGA